VDDHITVRLLVSGHERAFAGDLVRPAGSRISVVVTLYTTFVARKYYGKTIASHYYQITTRTDRIPLFIGERL
jgi:hypothetical protein